MRPFDHDPFEDHFEHFDKQFNRTFRAATIIGVLGALFRAGVIVVVLVLLWRNFA